MDPESEKKVLEDPSHAESIKALEKRFERLAEKDEPNEEGVVKCESNSGQRAMVRRKTWQEFRDYGLLWWVNRALHLLGWAIVVAVDEDSGKITDVYPARVRFRGFDEKSEEEGFRKVTWYLKGKVGELMEEAEE